ncbi:hypothetical protein EON64_12755 [archaeon]|nr:MAG: hypothetical protein EON64_12755 [archaeon]
MSAHDVLVYFKKHSQVRMEAPPSTGSGGEEGKEKERGREEARGEEKLDTHFPLPSPQLLEDTSPLTPWTQLCNKLYTFYIPRLASLLDNNGESVYDLESASRIFHAYGVNVRHMGIVYTLVTNPITKQLLLFNMLSRAAKVYVKSMWTVYLHQQIARTVTFLHKKRSGELDYRAHQQEISRAYLVHLLGVVNMLLHPDASDARSASIFTNVYDLVYTKFGLHLHHNSNLYAYIHMHPHNLQNNMVVFLSFLEQQLGIQIKPGVVSSATGTSASASACTASILNINPDDKTRLITRPLTIQDVYADPSYSSVPRASTPQSLDSSHTLSPRIRTSLPPLPGEVGYLAAHLQTLVRCKMYEDVSEVMGVYYMYIGHMLQYRFASNTTIGAVVFYYLYALYMSQGAAVLPRMQKIFTKYMHYAEQVGFSIHTARVLCVYMYVYYQGRQYDAMMKCFDSSLYITRNTTYTSHLVYTMPLAVLSYLYTQQYIQAPSTALMYNIQLMLELLVSIYQPNLTSTADLNNLRTQQALVSMHQQQFYQALDLLLPVAKFLETQGDSNSVLYVLVCHSMCVCYYHTQEHTMCLHYGNLLLTHPTPHKSTYKLFLSVQFVLYNVYIKQHEYHHALDILHILYTNLLYQGGSSMYKHGRQYVDILLYVAYNIVYLVLCTLPSHTKTLLESAAQDYKNYVVVQHSIHTNVADKSVLDLLQTHWTQCVAEVSARVLHKDCIVSYIALLVDSLQKKQADEKNEEKG